MRSLSSGDHRLHVSLDKFKLEPAAAVNLKETYSVDQGQELVIGSLGGIELMSDELAQSVILGAGDGYTSNNGHTRIL